MNKVDAGKTELNTQNPIARLIAMGSKIRKEQGYRHHSDCWLECPKYVQTI